MIPTAIVLGVIGGLIPRSGWWPIPLTGVIWSILLTVAGDQSMSFAEIWIGGFGFGAVNAAAGFLLSRGVSAAIRVRSERARPEMK